MIKPPFKVYMIIAKNLSVFLDRLFVILTKEELRLNYISEMEKLLHLRSGTGAGR